MKTTLNKLVSGSFALLLAINILCCSTDHVKQVRTFEQALNSHNIENYLTLFTDDISFRMGGLSGEGKQELRKIAEWDSVQKSQVLITFRRKNFNFVNDTFTNI